MALLEVVGLTKVYKQKIAVNHIDLKVEAGQLIAFLGPNGAGKSTTINMLTGIIEATTGQISLANRHPNQRDYQHNIGVVFQSSVLDGRLTVWQNLKSRAEMYRGCQLTIKNPLLTDLGLLPILQQKYNTLSGGQRRRVDIARALLQQPAVLFLDEPSTGLDLQTRTVIWQILNRLRTANGLTIIILTTHYLEEAETADFVYVIDHGQIIAGDTLPHLKQRYAPYRITVTTDQPDQVLAQVPTNWLVRQFAESIEIGVPDEAAVLPFLNQIQSLMPQFECRQGNLDDIFMTLTEKEIR